MRSLFEDTTEIIGNSKSSGPFHMYYYSGVHPGCRGIHVAPFVVVCVLQIIICPCVLVLLYMYMLYGCELIDTENISLPSQNMKLVGEWAKRTSHKLHILSSRLIFFQYQSYSHSDDIFITLKSTINTDTSIFVFSREKLHNSKYSKYASLKP